MKTFNNTLLILLFVLIISSCSKKDNPQQQDLEEEFVETQSEGYASMNTLFTSFGSVTNDSYDTYNQVAIGYRLDSNLGNFQSDLFNTQNLIINEKIAEYDPDIYNKITIKRIAFKPRYYDLTTNPISISHFNDGRTSVIFKMKLTNDDSIYEMEMQPIAGSTKLASEQIVIYNEFLNRYYEYYASPDFMNEAWGHEGVYIYKKNGVEIAKAESTFEDVINVVQAESNTQRKLVNNQVTITVEGKPYCQYQFSSENNDFEITYYNENNTFTKFHVTNEPSNNPFSLDELYNSVFDNYRDSTNPQRIVGIRMYYYKVLPLSCMALEGLLFSDDVLNITLSNQTDELALVLDYDRITNWETVSEEAVKNTNVMDAVISGELKVNNNVVFTLSRNGQDQLIAHYPKYNKDVDATDYFQEFVNPLETELEESIFN